MAKNRKIVIIVACSLAALVAAGGFIIWNKSKNPVSSPGEISGWLNPAAPKENPVANTGISAAFRTYTHPVHGFSFDYPADWSLDVFSDPPDGEAGEGEETVVLQNAETGIAVFIYPFDEPGPITKKRILRDVPDIKIENEIGLKIAGGSIDALGFDSNERELGPTKEVWFVHGGFLYQISGAQGSGEALYIIVESWKFN